VAELNERMAEAQPLSDAEANPGEGGHDYIIITRQVPATKDKWRIVPSDVEEDEGEK
jgi:hypothetical protein